MDTAQEIEEVMRRYDEARATWIARLGTRFNEAAFHAWFTAQITQRKEQSK